MPTRPARPPLSAKRSSATSAQVAELTPEERRERRYRHFRALGQFETVGPVSGGRRPRGATDAVCPCARGQWSP